mmetsp:Transcript_17874/g.22688  ORF Transcript_17874/g.22688 Transcript_17874/m.22688 type:complete len:91 (+) Transcript_17874:113-385(+)
MMLSDLSVRNETRPNRISPVTSPACLNANGIPMIPAPTIELMRLEDVPKMPDFLFGMDKLLVCAEGGERAISVPAPDVGNPPLDTPITAL